MMTLPELLARSVKQYPDRLAAEEPNGAGITYAALDDLSNRLAALILGVNKVALEKAKRGLYP